MLKAREKKYRRKMIGRPLKSNARKAWMPFTINAKIY